MAEPADQAADMLEAEGAQAHGKLGPTDIADPLLRREAKRAMVWLGIASLIALAVVLAESLLIIFGGIIFGALVDGGARLLGRILPIGRGWRVAIVLLLTAGFLGWVVWFAGSQIADQAAELPALVETQTLRLFAWLRGHGFVVHTEDVQGIAEKVIGGVAEVTKALGGIIGAATTVFVIIVLGVYFSVEPRLYQRGLAWMLPLDRRSHFEETFAMMGHSLRRLLAGRLLGMSVEGVFTWFMLQVYGVPMAALLGLLTGLLAFLPNIGAPLSGALMILVGFSGGTSMGFYCIFVYLAVHTIDGNVIVPLVARKTVDLAPALVLGAQLIMGVLFGILGLVLADPLLVLIKILLEREAARGEPAEA